MTTVDVASPARALAIGAHPDDIEFGCGATLAKWSQSGCEASLLICTDGSKGTWDINADTAALVDCRRKEQFQAAERLGVTGEVRFLGEVDGELQVNLTLRRRIAQVIRELRPEVVLGHDPFKRWRLHPDHRAAGFLCMDALLAARDPHFYRELLRDHGLAHHRPDELLLFESEAPDHFEQVDQNQITAKVNALLAHESQFESTHGISSDDDGAQAAAFGAGIFEECRSAGIRAGVGLAEAFKRVEHV